VIDAPDLVQKNLLISKKFNKITVNKAVDVQLKKNQLNHYHLQYQKEMMT
jgi:hypothetical protein